MIDGLAAKYYVEPKYTPVKLQGRWTSYCIAVDFMTNTTAYFVDGQELSGWYIQMRDFKELFSDNTNLPMVVRIGHYYFDDKPTIGRIIDINLWSRFLAFEELAKYSDCKVHEMKSGNVINQSTQFHITGSLITKIEVPVEDCLCTRQHTRRTLNVHVPFLSFDLAKMACDKYLVGSMVGPFEVKQQWDFELMIMYEMIISSNSSYVLPPGSG